jgi:hypothetical protein
MGGGDIHLLELVVDDDDEPDDVSVVDRNNGVGDATLSQAGERRPRSVRFELHGYVPAMAVRPA